MNEKTKTVTLTIDGEDVEFIRADGTEAKQISKDLKIIRTYSAGVHVGNYDGKWGGEGKPIVLKNARRIHYWKGANTLNEISLSGLDRSQSRISKSVDSIEIVPIEILPVCEGVDLSECWDG